MLNKLRFLIVLGFLSSLTFSQVNDAENIKTVIFIPSLSNSYVPIIKLGQTLQLSFDDLNADEQEYFYEITHCEIDWTPSKLVASEFISGFEKDRIREFNNSFNTLLDYTNYQLKIPNQNTRIKITGNYLLTVYNESDEIAFQRRFVVYQPKVIVAVGIHKSRNIATLNTHQSVQFSITNNSLQINNPSREIMPVILQNNNWQTAITNLKPQFIRGKQLLYKYGEETNYWGGNEFLYFDSKDIRNATLNIAKSVLENDIYHTYLYIDEGRAFEPYTYLEDINGNFLVRSLYSEYQNIESDYTRVFFSLDPSERITNKDIFVSGNFNNWKLSDENKLEFNSNSGLYETSILLKQGFYNYQFVTQNDKKQINFHQIDGSYYETENDYTVLVYYKRFGARYTEVVGAGFGSSKVILN